MSPSQKKKTKNEPGSRFDHRWEHGTEIDCNSRKVKCKYCQIVCSGGLYRQHHLAGTSLNVEPCPKVPDEAKNKFLGILINQCEKSRKKKKRLFPDIEEEEVQEISKSGSKGKGTLDRFSRKTSQTTMN